MQRGFNQEFFAQGSGPVTTENEMYSW
jgi:hypothetical protein